VSSRPEQGTATYELKAHHHAATVLGAPAIHARLAVGGANPANAQIAARLWDVSRDGTKQTLVDRGTYRPHDGANSWQLHPASWRFAKGHTPRLELLGSDAPYARPSNGHFRVDVKRLRLRLPAQARRR
jgi:predicted acyl esterase